MKSASAKFNPPPVQSTQVPTTNSPSVSRRTSATAIITSSPTQTLAQALSLPNRGKSTLGMAPVHTRTGAVSDAEIKKLMIADEPLLAWIEAAGVSEVSAWAIDQLGLTPALTNRLKTIWSCTKADSVTKPLSSDSAIEIGILVSRWLTLQPEELVASFSQDIATLKRTIPANEFPLAVCQAYSKMLQKRPACGKPSLADQIKSPQLTLQVAHPPLDRIALFDIPGATTLPKPSVTVGSKFVPDPVVYWVLPQNQRLLEALTHCLASRTKRNRAVHLEGPPGTGKTEVTRYIASKLKIPYYLVSCSGETDRDALIGSFTPGNLRYDEGQISGLKRDAMIVALRDDTSVDVASLDPLSDDELRAACQDAAKPVFRPGPLAVAVEHGGLLVLDEVDTLKPEVLTALHSVLDDSGQLNVGGRVIPCHNDFYLMSTGNGMGYPGRKAPTAALSSRRTTFTFPEWGAEDFLNFMVGSFGQKIPQDILVKVIAIHMKLARLAKTIPQGLAPTVGDIELTPRNLIRVGKRILEFAAAHPELSSLEVAGREFCEVYGGAILKPEIKKLFLNEVKAQFGDLSKVDKFYKNLKLVDNGPSITIGDITIDKRQLASPMVPRSIDIKLTSRVLRTMYHLAKCRKFHESAFLVGERGTGKTAIVRYLSHLLGDALYQQNLTPDTEAYDFVGGFSPMGWAPGLFCQATDSKGQGGTLFLDEFNLAPYELQVFLNAMLAGAKEIILTQKGNERWPIHPEAHVVSCANPKTPDYAGTKKLDAATTSRFVFLEVGEPDQAELTQIVREIAKDHALNLAKVMPQLDQTALLANYEKVADVIVQIQTMLDDAYRNRSNALNSLNPLGKVKREDRPELSMRSIDRVLDICSVLVGDGYEVGEALDKALVDQYVLGAPENLRAGSDKKNQDLIREFITETLARDVVTAGVKLDMPIAVEQTGTNILRPMEVDSTDRSNRFADAFRDDIDLETVMRAIAREPWRLNAEILFWDLNPLMLAMKKNDCKAIDALLEKGADVSIVTSHGKSAYDFGSQYMCDYLRNHKLNLT